MTENKEEKPQTPTRSTAIIGPDHPKANLIARVFGKALCHGSLGEPEKKETSEND